MMKKRSCIAVVFALGALLGLYGQNAGPIDLILLLDTSSSMSNAYQEVNSYITGAFLKEFLRTGDTFHLIAFSDRPRLEISRRVEGRGDLETIIGRMFLQYPLDPWSDIPAALSFAEQYAASLPSRPKKIVLVSDGAAASAPGGSSSGIDAAGLSALIAASKARLAAHNIGLELVKITPGQPLAKLPASGRTPRPAPPEQTPPASTPPVTPPAAASVQQPSAPVSSTAQSVQPVTPPAQTPPVSMQPPVTSAPSTTQQTQPVTPPAQTPPVSMQPSATSAPSTTRPAQPVTPPSASAQQPSAPVSSTAQPAQPVTPPAQTPPVSIQPPVTSAPSTTQQMQPVTPPAQIPPSSAQQPTIPAPSATQPTQSVVEPPAHPIFESGDFRLLLFTGLGLLVLIGLGLGIFFVSRNLHASPNRVLAQAATLRRVDGSLPPFVDHSKDFANHAVNQPQTRSSPYTDRYSAQPPLAIDPSGPLILNLFVEDQNTFIGKRNIHALKSGYSLSIGGGKSDFLIFLVPVPPLIAEVRRDGSHCIFIPRKPRYFPDLGAQELHDCIGKTIRVISDHNYQLLIRLERYENPLIALNQLLNSLNISS